MAPQQKRQQHPLPLSARGAAGVSLAVLSLTLLSGCGGDAESNSSASATTSQSTAESASASTSPRESAPGESAHAAEPTEGTGTASSSSAPQAAGSAERLPTQQDPCAANPACQETGRLEVQHPRFGPLQIVTYFEPTSPAGGVPVTGLGSYAIYQDGRAVGFKQAPGISTGFGPNPTGARPVLRLQGGTNIDRWGNVFLVGEGITVLTPTDLGYDSRGSMPGGDSPFRFARMATIEADGSSRIIAPQVNENQETTGKMLTWAWDEQAGRFAPLSTAAAGG